MAYEWMLEPHLLGVVALLWGAPLSSEPPPAKGGSAALAPVLSRSKPPGQNFDLRSFKLQLPVGKPRGGVLEIKQPTLSTYQSPYFYTDPDSGAMVFACPDHGATTGGSHHPRSELRDLREWSFSGSHHLAATLAVGQQPSSKSIIVGQIHGSLPGSEAVKIRWVDGAIYAAIKTTLGTKEQKILLASGLKLGQVFSYTISQVGREVTITVNGASTKATFDGSWDADQLYFKAGNYLQDDSASGSAGRVSFLALEAMAGR